MSDRIFATPKPLDIESDARQLAEQVKRGDVDASRLDGDDPTAKRAKEIVGKRVLSVVVKRGTRKTDGIKGGCGR